MVAKLKKTGETALTDGETGSAEKPKWLTIFFHLFATMSEIPSACWRAIRYQSLSSELSITTNLSAGLHLWQRCIPWISPLLWQFLSTQQFRHYYLLSDEDIK
jgi:hypothetical protein